MRIIAAFAALLTLSACATSPSPSVSTNPLITSAAPAPTPTPSTPVVYSPAVPTAPVYVPPSHYYITGPRGGCYYINSNGNKTYVDHSFCN